MSRLPRWAAFLVLALTAAACLWSVPATQRYSDDLAADRSLRVAHGSRGDFDLYETIHRRVAGGDDYYTAALEEQRSRRFPTSPFITVRTPVLAWSSLPFGLTGWRVVAPALWLATLVGLLGLLHGRTSTPERIGAALCAGIFGVIAFMPRVGLGHEIIAGLFLSAALALYRPDRWWPALLLAACGLAVRALALPFLLLWGAFAATRRRWRELAAIAAVLLLFTGGMALHARAVAAAQMPGDIVSPGWTGLQGPALAISGLLLVTPLQALPHWLGPPLAVLPLLGWAAVGGRTGLFATLWFAGFMLAVALFARLDNYYWMSLVVPAYGAGLALVPRALGDLTAAVTRQNSQNRRHDTVHRRRDTPS